MSAAAGSVEFSNVMQAALDPGSSIQSLLLAHLPPADRARLSITCRRAYHLVFGEPLLHLVGRADRYALVRGLRRSDAERFRHETGRHVVIPAGQASIGVVTSWNDPEEGSLLLGKGTFNLFTIGFALREKRFVGLRIVQGEEEIQAELEVEGMLPREAGLLSSIDSVRGADRLVQVVELAGLGDLEHLRAAIRSCTDLEFLEGLLRHIAKGLMEQVRALHHARVAHLDVKCDNLVFGPGGNPHLIDYGCARKMESGRVLGLKGDNNIFSPERWIASTKAPDSDEALSKGEPLDVWSVGVVLIEMFSPDPHLLPARDIDAILQLPLELWPQSIAAEMVGLERAPRSEQLTHYCQKRIERALSALPERARPLVQGLLHPDPAQRLTLEQALADPWMALPGPDGIGDRLRELKQEQQQQPVSGDLHFRLSPQDVPLPHFYYYVGRPELEARIKARLLSSEAATALVGLPGRGKTQLATRLFHDPEVQAHYGRRFWFSGADQVAQIEAQLVTLAAELEIGSAEAEFDQIWPRLRAQLEGEPRPPLLVFDNAEHPEKIAQYVPRGASYLVTSRESGWEGEQEVRSLELADSRRLASHLLQRAGLEVDQLCEALGGVPLALVQACAFLRNQRWKIADYLRLLERTPTLGAQDEKLGGHRKLACTIREMYRLTFRQLERRGSLPALQRLACLGPDPLPAPLVQQLAGDHHTAELSRFELLQRVGADAYVLHRLPRQAVREEMPESELAVTMGALNARLEPEEEDFARIQRNRRLLPHGAACLELLTEADVPPSLAAVSGEMMGWVAGVSARSSNMQLAERYLVPSVRLSRATLEGIPLAVSLSTAARTANHLRMGDSAIEYANESAALFGDRAESRGPMGELVITLFEAGNYLAARRLGEQVLALHEEGTRDQAMAYNDLAMVCQRQRELELAEAHSRRALAIYTEHPLEKDGALAVARYTLGLTLLYSKKYEEAEAEIRASLALKREVFGDEHEEVAKGENLLGGFFNEQNNPAGGLPHFRTALAIRERIFGDHHSATVNSLYSVATALFRTGSLDEALEMQSRAYRVACALSVMGSKHPNTLRVKELLDEIEAAVEERDRAPTPEPGSGF